jgi:hypothetical protein
MKSFITGCLATTLMTVLFGVALTTQNPASSASPAGRGAGRGARAGNGPRRGANGAPAFGTDEDAALLFEEHWTNSPLTQPIKQENLGNQNLRLHLAAKAGG